VDYVRAILENWINSEPTAGLWLVVASVLLFGVTFLRLRRQDERAWGRHLLVAFSTGLAFAVVAGMLYFLSTSSYAAFSQVYGPFVKGGSLSNQAWKQWKKMHGGGYYQQDLTVAQTFTVETEEIVQPSDPSAAPWVRKIKTEQPVTQNNILGFRGNVTINLADPGNQANGFDAYLLTANYEYDTVNPTETEVHTVFLFPLSQESKLYEDIRIQVDGQEVDWKIVGSDIAWEGWMKPGEKNVVRISFVTSGMDGFNFEIPQQREVVNFDLKVYLDTDNC
jgi:hypothetical protein